MSDKHPPQKPSPKPTVTYVAPVPELHEFGVPSTMFCVAMLTTELRLAHVNAKPGFTGKCCAHLSEAAKYAHALNELVFHETIVEIMGILKPDIVIPEDNYPFLRDRCRFVLHKWMECLQSNSTRYIPSRI